MTPAGLSVCIPTHTGRGPLVAELLGCVVQSTRHISEPVEVLVIDDATGREAEQVERRCTAVGAQYLRGPRSAGLKRNIAAATARYDILFFVDSDCLVTPRTLAAHLASLREAPSDVAGVVGLTEMSGEITKVWRTIEGSQFHNPCFDFAERYVQVGWGTTANLSVRREVLLTAGGFAAGSFTLVGGEDVDFGLRVTRLGYRWVTSAEALVLHRRSPITQLGHVAERLFTYGRADVFLADQHRDRRDTHLNPYAIGLVGLVGTLLTSGKVRRAALATAGVLPIATLVAEARRRRTSSDTLYGARSQVSGRRSLLHDLRSTIIDSLFDAGITWEAVRRRRPLSAFVRFGYVDDRTFVPRRRRNP